MSLSKGTRPVAQAAPAGVSSETQISSLVALLEEEASVVKALIGAAQAKKEAILAQDIKAIEEAARREEGLLDELQSLEGKRLAWVQAWAAKSRSDQPRAKGGGKAQITVSEIASSLPEAQAGTVRRAAGELERLLGELDELNGENAALLFHSLAFVQAMIDAITGAQEKTNVYGPKGSQPRGGTGKATVEWRA